VGGGGHGNPVSSVGLGGERERHTQVKERSKKRVSGRELVVCAKKNNLALLSSIVDPGKSRRSPMGGYEEGGRKKKKDGNRKRGTIHSLLVKRSKRQRI